MTRQQHRLLTFIRVQIVREGVAPSLDEMREELGLKSAGSVHRMLVALEKAGSIEREPRKARAITIRDECASHGMPLVALTPEAMVKARRCASETGKSLTDYVSACVHYFDVGRP